MLDIISNISKKKQTLFSINLAKIKQYLKDIKLLYSLIDLSK